MAPLPNWLQNFQKRNVSASETQPFTTGDAVWQDFTVEKATTEGYRINGWVYKAVKMVADKASGVPFKVYTQEGEEIPDHPVALLLDNPNPQFSRQRFYWLLSAWLELAGNSFAALVGEASADGELWPIPPDRLAPKASTEAGQMVSGYSYKDVNGTEQNSSEYTPENVAHLLYPDPAQPLIGMPPLRAAGAAVDLDGSMQDFNQSAMQNRGVVDGIFTFDRDLTTEQHKTVKQRVGEFFGGPRRAREPLVVGNNASFTRLALTPAEMDFIASRRWNREEIAGVFDIPLPLMGSSESMTYNNFREALKIMWEGKMSPHLRMIADGLDHLFRKRGDLAEGEWIGYDLSGVEAMRSNEKERADTAKAYWEMGVPMDQINERMGLSFEAFQGSDVPFTGSKPLLVAAGGEGNSGGRNSGGSSAGSEGRGLHLLPMERRDYTAEAEAKDATTTETIYPVVLDLLTRDRDAVFAALDDVSNPDETVVDSWLEERGGDWSDTLNPVAASVARDWAATVAVDERGAYPFMETRQGDEAEQRIQERIASYLEEEALVLEEYSHIRAGTVALVAEQVAQAADEGWTTQEVKQAVDDVGVFGSVRALRISRTMTAATSSIGQLSSAEEAGARTKTWETSEFEVRGLHVNRSGETVGMDEAFSVQAGGAGPRFPGDPRVAPEDRINCRCSMTFGTGEPG